MKGQWQLTSVDSSGRVRLERLTSSGRLEYKYVDAQKEGTK